MTSVRAEQPERPRASATASETERRGRRVGWFAVGLERRVTLFISGEHMRVRRGGKRGVGLRTGGGNGGVGGAREGPRGTEGKVGWRHARKPGAPGSASDE